ncbi:hypothetical protein AFLA_011304 [Aspergillus flavus NRRL3357]|nr:hypothetical protein AFLA_011304 [Aspergillus flavus NRRL3357]
MASNSVIPVDQPNTTAEILRLQNRLTDIRNQRKILELRNEIARESQLLADAQHRLQATESQMMTGDRSLNSSHTPTRLTAGSAIPADKGIKKRGAKASHKQKHFASDKNKIAEAKRHLSRLILDEWTTLEESSGRTHTWDEFCFFLLRQIERPATPRLARHRWNVTRKHCDETVQDFANYLVMLEDDFSTSLSEHERSQRLCNGMSSSLQKRARDDSSFFTLRYAAQVELLAK